MRALLALLAIVLLAVGITACGSASKGTSSSATGGTSTTTASGASSGAYRKDDGDKDSDDLGSPSGSQDDDRVLLAAYGKEASKAEIKAVTAVLGSYYAAATAGDATKACSLLDPSLASGLAVAPSSKTAHGGGKDCASVVSVLYKQQHAQLVADDPATMVVTDLRVKNNLALAELGFKTVPKGAILVEREDGAWKVDALFNSQMP